MTGDAPRLTELRYEDYLALERETDLRHEWVDGVARVYRGVTLTPETTPERG